MPSSVVSRCWRAARRYALKASCWRSACVLYSLLCFVALPDLGQTAKTRCGRELVADLEFVCGDRGFYRGKIGGARNGHRYKGKGIVEQCCLRGCDLQHLETYCAKPKQGQTTPSPEEIMEKQFQAVLRKRILSFADLRAGQDTATHRVRVLPPPKGQVQKSRRKETHTERPTSSPSDPWSSVATTTLMLATWTL